MAFRKERTTAREVNSLLKKIIKPYHGNTIDDEIIASLLKIDREKYVEILNDNVVPYKEVLDYCIEIELDPIKLFYKNISRLRRLG